MLITTAFLLRKTSKV